MDVPAAAKLAVVGECLDELERRFEVMSLERHAALLASATLPVREPRFAAARP
jgi:hypothetical protein